MTCHNAGMSEERIPMSCGHAVYRKELRPGNLCPHDDGFPKMDRREEWDDGTPASDIPKVEGIPE